MAQKVALSYLRSPTGSWLLECPNGSSSALATSFRVTNEPTAMNEIVIALHIASHSRTITQSSENTHGLACKFPASL